MHVVLRLAPFLGALIVSVVSFCLSGLATAR
jgi:hypothetical protein